MSIERAKESYGGDITPAEREDDVYNIEDEDFWTRFDGTW